MSQDGTQAIRRAAAILKRIAHVSKDGPVTLRDVSESLDLSRSTAHRMLKCLTETGLAAYDPKSRGYEIGILGYELGLAVTDRVLDLAPCMAAVDRLAERANVTAYLMRRSGMEAVCIHKAEARSVIRVIPVEVGQRRFLGVGAGATALLAALPDAAVARILDAIESDLGSYNDLDRAVVTEAVAQARLTGFAESRSRAYAAIYGLGRAVGGPARETDLAISIAAHVSEADDRSVARWKALMATEAEALAVRSGPAEDAGLREGVDLAGRKPPGGERR